MDFSETIVVCGVKVGRCSELNEYMSLYEYQRSRSTLVNVKALEVITMPWCWLFPHRSWRICYTNSYYNVCPSMSQPYL